ncbi:MAG TPA: hypothetical protein DCK95_01240 [Anaerolineaceae bacterium]|nr:hypothetical protein [Anaerolineaceae bacterium]
MTEQSKNKILLPRVIYGNRGDILSRWGLLNGLLSLGQRDIKVFAHLPGDLPNEFCNTFYPYGKYHNLLLSHDARKALHESDRILWGGGLDLTDESSKAKLLYLSVLFSRYRKLGKQIDCVFQGAGPIVTSTGKVLTRQILNKTNHFIARDEYTLNLLHTINPATKLTLAGDAIFMPGFEDQINEHDQPSAIVPFVPPEGQLLVAINIRRWFHFSSDLIPFQLAKKRYENRGQQEMDRLVQIYVDLARKLRREYDARVLLVSAYNPGVFSWEDDMPWLQKIKTAFPLDDDVCLLDENLDMLDYLSLMSKVDMAISMRLHSSLTALRFGNPAVNISYSPKGVYVFNTLGLGDHAVEINTAMQQPDRIWQEVQLVLSNLSVEKQKVRIGVASLIEKNMDVLGSLFMEANE